MGRKKYISKRASVIIISTDQTTVHMGNNKLSFLGCNMIQSVFPAIKYLSGLCLTNVAVIRFSRFSAQFVNLWGPFMTKRRGDANEPAHLASRRTSNRAGGTRSINCGMPTVQFVFHSSLLWAKSAQALSKAARNSIPPSINCFARRSISRSRSM